MIKQFLTDVVWGGVDFLIIDTPPGGCCGGGMREDRRRRGEVGEGGRRKGRWREELDLKLKGVNRVKKGCLLLVGSLDELITSCSFFCW